MAKDDYYVIVAKILVYLYKKYKCLNIDGTYICPMSKDFPISQEQLWETISMMESQGFITGNITRSWGGDIILVDYSSLKIMPAGIDYLIENTTIRKVCNTLKEAKEIVSLFM